jgi:phage baseplate assembly protein W
MPVPEDMNPDMQIGLTLPLINGSNGYFQTTLTHLEQAKHNLKNLLLTVKGERVMQPELGCDIWKMVFDQNDTAVEMKAEQYIRDAVGQWLPYLELKSIKVVNTFTEIDNNILRVELIFNLIDDPDAYDSIEFDVNSFVNF